VENRADDTPDNPKNIIMIIGDGMGPAYTTAFRYLHDDPSTIDVEKTVFDRHLIGLSSTYPAAVSGYVTDSAASATALASGVKTYNGAIGVSLDKQPLNSVVTFAKQAGKKTGVVVTSQVNHATPASFLTHNEDRNNYDAIADSFFNNMQSSKYQFDVLFGGGWKYFRRKDRDLVEEFKKIGFQYADSYSQLNSLRTGTPALGLFADVGLPWALDDSEPNRLLKMTQTAIELLENESGFFMLIEASQIDWAGHANDITAAMGEMYDLAKTLEFLEVYVQKNPNTLVLVTADHSTGGLTIGANNKYEWTPDILRTMKHTPSNIAKLLNQTQMSKQDLNDLLNFTLTAEEYSKLQQIKASSEKQAVSKIDSMNSRESGLYSTLKKIIDTRTNTGWTTGGHTADDVPVLAFGSQYEVFIGHNDNTDLAKKVFNLLGKK
jgi:alkaline phosphatase